MHGPSFLLALATSNAGSSAKKTTTFFHTIFSLVFCPKDHTRLYQAAHASATLELGQIDRSRIEDKCSAGLESVLLLSCLVLWSESRDCRPFVTGMWCQIRESNSGFHAWRAEEPPRGQHKDLAPFRSRSRPPARSRVCFRSRARPASRRSHRCLPGTPQDACRQRGVTMPCLCRR